MVQGQRTKGRQNRTWKKQVKEESVKVGLSREDALCRSKWAVGDKDEVNLVTLTFWGYYHILDIGLSLQACFQKQSL